MEWFFVYAHGMVFYVKYTVPGVFYVQKSWNTHTQTRGAKEGLKCMFQDAEVYTALLLERAPKRSATQNSARAQ